MKSQNIIHSEYCKVHNNKNTVHFSIYKRVYLVEDVRNHFSSYTEILVHVYNSRLYSIFFLFIILFSTNKFLEIQACGGLAPGLGVSLLYCKRIVLKSRRTVIGMSVKLQ